MAPVQDEATNTTVIIRKALFMKRDSGAGGSGAMRSTLELSESGRHVGATLLSLLAASDHPIENRDGRAAWKRDRRGTSYPYGSASTRPVGE
jgi:hypothetical protein